MHANKLKVLLILPLLIATTPAHAYIGPGAGAGTIAVVLGILASIGMAVFALVWYPLKRLFRKPKPAGAAGADASGSTDDS